MCVDCGCEWAAPTHARNDLVHAASGAARTTRSSGSRTGSALPDHVRFRGLRRLILLHLRLLGELPELAVGAEDPVEQPDRPVVAARLVVVPVVIGGVA